MKFFNIIIAFAMSLAVEQSLATLDEVTVNQLGEMIACSKVSDNGVRVPYANESSTFKTYKDSFGKIAKSLCIQNRFRNCINSLKDWNRSLREGPSFMDQMKAKLGDAPRYAILSLDT